MKTLNDEQKEKMWREIERALQHSSGPQVGEYTTSQLRQITGYGKTKLNNLLRKLEEAEILGVRTGVYNGTSCNIYFPIKETDLEEILEVLIK